MSAPGRPKRELLPLGGKARSAKGVLIRAPGRPQRELLHLRGTARSANGSTPLRFYCELVCSETSRAMMMAG